MLTCSQLLAMSADAKGPVFLLAVLCQIQIRITLQLFCEYSFQIVSVKIYTSLGIALKIFLFVLLQMTWV